MSKPRKPLTPMVTDAWARASVLGAAALILLVIPPFVADGRQIVFWSDAGLVALALLAAVWLRRQRRSWPAARPAPLDAVPASERRVVLRHAAWGVPFLLFVLAVAVGDPQLSGFGFATAVLAAALAREAVWIARLERECGARLYRGRPRGWNERVEIYRV